MKAIPEPWDIPMRYFAFEAPSQSLGAQGLDHHHVSPYYAITG
jgi:hypothetical protein